MSEAILQRSFVDSENRFTEKKKYNKLDVYRHRGVIPLRLIDPIFPSPDMNHPSLLYSAHSVWYKATTVQSVDGKLYSYFDGTKKAVFEFDPKTHPTRRMMLKFEFGAPSANTLCEYPAISTVKDVLVKHGKEEIHNFEDYPLVYKANLSTKSTDDQQAILQNAGGVPAATTAASGVSELIIFWSPHIHNHRENVYTRPLVVSDRCKSNIRVEVTLQPYDYFFNTSGGAGDTGVLTSLELYYEAIVTHTPSHFRHQSMIYGFPYKSVDYQTLNAYTAVATATDVTVDLSTLQGIIKAYWFMDLLTTKVTTTRNILDTDSALTKLYLTFNGHKFEDEITGNAAIRHRDYMQYCNVAVPYISAAQKTLQPAHVITFSLTGAGKDVTSYLGGHNMTGNTVTKAIVRQASGSAHSVNVVAVKHAKYIYEGEVFKKFL